MSDVLPIKLQVSGDTKAVAAVRKEVEQLAAASAKTSTQASAASAKQAQAYSKIQQSAAQAGVANQKLAAETQKTATASNNAATAAQKLATEEQRTAAAASNATAAHARAEKAILSLAQAQNKAAQGSNYLAQVGDSVKSSLTGIIGPAAAIGTAIAALKGGADLAQLGAQTGLVNTRFNTLAQTAGTTGAAIMGALRTGSGGEISNLNLQLAANKAQMLGVADSAKEFGTLMAVARDRAQQMGISTTQAFDDLTTGLGRGSKLILDNLGIIVNTDQANQSYAASVGKTVSALTDQERKQALINQVLKDGQATIAATGGAVESAAGTFAQLGAATENAKASVGRVAAEILKIPAQKAVTILVKVSGNLDVLAGATDKLQEFSERAFSGAKSFEDYEARVKSVNAQLAPFGTNIKSLSAESYNYAQALAKTGTSADAAFNKSLQYSGILEKITGAMQAAGGAGGSWDTTMSSLGQRAAEVASQSEYSRVAVEGLATAFAAGGMTSDQLAAALAALEARHIAAANAATQDALEENRLAISHSLVTQASTGLSQAIQDEITKKQTAAVEGQKLADVQELLASIGAAVASGQITAGQGALNFAAMTGVAISKARELINLQAQLAGGKGGTVAEGRAERDTSADRAAGAAAGAAAARARADAVKDARDQQTLAIGTSAQKQALLKSDYNTAVKLYGAESAQAISAQTKMLQAQKTGGAARVSAAQQGADKLAAIEDKTGTKLADIIQSTQQKITAIAEREAAKQAAALTKLNESIATSAADRRASTESDDLDLIGPMDEKQAQKLNDREKAQADARKREEAAAAEARATAEAGDAESAGKIYDIREKQISDQQALDEKYYAKQRELAEDPASQEALKQQYDEATRANDAAAQTRIALAQAEAAQKAAAVEAEKAAVIAAAEDEANKVISAAERSAAGVTKATAAAKAAAVADLNAIGSAVTAIPTSKTITITVNQQGSVGTASTGGGSSGNKAAGGGTFMTTGKTTLTVGDNPGGREIVTVTPVSGTGQTRVGKGMIAMAGGGTVDAGGGYTTPIAGSGAAPASGGGGGGKGGGKAATAVDPKKALDEMKNTIQLLMDMAKLKEQIAELAGVPAFDIPLVQALVQRAQEFTAFVSQNLIKVTKEEGEALGRYLNAAKDAASMIGDMASLKKDIAELKDVPAFDKAMVFALIDRAQEFTTAVQQHLIPLTEFERDQMGRYASTVGDVVGILKDMSDLKKDLAKPSPPIDTRYINQFVADAAVVTVIMRAQLIGTTEDQADALSRYASVVGDSVSILKDVSDLQKELAEPHAPISPAVVLSLADEAMQVVNIMRGRLVPTTEAQAEALSSYASVGGDTVSILSDVLSLGKDLKEGGAPAIPDSMIIQLGDQARRIVQLIQGRLLPATEEQQTALSAYADLVSSSTSILSDVAGLGGDLFTDYTSPTDAQIAMLADDARRITKAFFDAGQIMGKDGAGAGKAYAEGVGAAFSAAKEGLLVIDALKSGDFVLPEGALRQFQNSSMDVLTTMQALGARAAQIPASDIAALASVTASISGQAEAMIKLAAVPWGDLGNAVQGLSSSGGAMGGMGGSTTITNYNTFQLPQGTPQQIANEALRILNQQMGSRR